MKMISKTLILLIVALTASSEISDNEEIVPLGGSIGQRIWNGKNAVMGQFPYQGLLYMTLEDGKNAFCGGSLISPKHILTAAHCCANVSSIEVFLGLVNVSTARESSVQKFDVPKSSFSIHENYDPNTISNDICILKLPTAASINENVSTVALPNQMDTNPSQYNYKTANISGWGQTNDLEGLHSDLQWSTVTLQPHRLCALIYSFINQVSESQLCSGKVIRYTGPCHGDSGGPLTVMDETTKKPVEIGLVSWGVGSCASFNPVVYTYVPAFVDWIKTHMN